MAYGQSGLLRRLTFNVRFPGQYFDAESGMHYNRHRYYEPASGRYISADPIGQVSGANVFAYARTNPMRLIDSLGLWADLRRISGTAGFLKNYFYGGGPVDLGNSNLGAAYENSPDARRAVDGFDALLAERAKEVAEAACRKCPPGGNATASFSESDSAITNSTAQPGLYAVGHSTMSSTASCSLRVDCDTGAYTYSCDTNHSIDDEFIDALDELDLIPGNQDIPGATTFPITHSFGRSTAGAGRY